MHAAMLRSAASLLLVCGALGAVTLPAATALGHPLLDEARRRFDDADFGGALDVLGRAEQGSLTADELVRLLADRALVRFALGDRPGLDEDLLRLALVAPDHDFGAAAPPELREGFERARAATASQRLLEVRATPRIGGVALHLELAPAAGSLVRSVRLRGRPVGGAWIVAEGASLLVTVGPGEEAEFEAVATGPGGVTLAEVASSARALRSAVAAPVAVASPEPIAAVPRPVPRAPSRARGGASPWIWVGAGAAVAALAVGALAILASSGSSDGRTLPSLPRVVE